MYIVISEFKDLKDNNHIYNEGKIYPYKENELDTERIEELSGTSNRLNKVLIKKIALEEATEEQLIEFVRREGLDIRQMILSAIAKETNTKEKELNTNEKELKELKKQAKKMKIDFSEETDIEELKQLIENAGNKE